MPFCTSCGKQVGDQDSFCAACGASQGVGTGPQSSAPSDFLASLDAHTASILCYVPVLGCIPAIIVLASQRFQADRQARFHAFQSLYLFVAWLILDWNFLPFHAWSRIPVVGILKAVIIGCSVFMLIKTSRREHYRLPLFGELADKSLNEQPKRP